MLDSQPVPDVGLSASDLSEEEGFDSVISTASTSPSTLDNSEINLQSDVVLDQFFMNTVPVIHSDTLIQTRWFFTAWTDRVPDVVVIDTTPTVMATLYRPRIIPVNFAGRNLDLGYSACRIVYCTQEPRSRICHFLTVQELVQFRRVSLFWTSIIHIVQPSSNEPMPEPGLSEDIVVFLR